MKKKLEVKPSAKMDSVFWEKFDQEFRAQAEPSFMAKWWKLGLGAMALSAIFAFYLGSVQTDNQEASLMAQYEKDYWETQDMLDQELLSDELVEYGESSEEDFLI